MPMTPGEHDAHMQEMMAGLQQCKQIIDGLLGAEKGEAEVEEGQSPGEGEDLRSKLAAAMPKGE